MAREGGALNTAFPPSVVPEGLFEGVGLVIDYFKMKRNGCCVPENLSGGLKALEHFASYCFPFRMQGKTLSPYIKFYV